MGNVQNVEVVRNQLNGEREALEFTVVRFWRRIINSKVFRQGNNIELDRTLVEKRKCDLLGQI